MSYAAPKRPSRSYADADSLPIPRIPSDRASILPSLAIAQHHYEWAKANLTTLETDKLDLTEAISRETEEITDTIASQPHPSMAAQERAVKAALAASPSIRASEERIREINRALGPAKEDVSVFRHRMLTLRAALAPDPETALVLNDEGGDR